MPGSSPSSASLAPVCSTLAPRIAPVGAASPSARRSAGRSGRSHTNSLSRTRHDALPWEVRSLVSGSPSAIRPTPPQPATRSADRRGGASRTRPHPALLEQLDLLPGHLGAVLGVRVRRALEVQVLRVDRLLV